MNQKDFIKNILTDTKVKLSDEFDKNFERKAFFDKRWKQSKSIRNIGSTLNRTGALRKSVQSRIVSNQVSWTSSLPYAEIQNEGGKIQVTKKMKGYFWAMYYKASGAVTSSIKSKKENNTIRNRKLNNEAQYWKAMALKKVGSTITIEQRQFLGHHPQVDRMVRNIIHRNITELTKQIQKEHGSNRT